MPSATAVRADIDFQAQRDARRAFDRPQLDVRIQNVYNARDALARGQNGAAWALRQSLIELASACEVMARGMRVPTVDLR